MYKNVCLRLLNRAAGGAAQWLAPSSPEDESVVGVQPPRPEFVLYVRVQAVVPNPLRVVPLADVSTEGNVPLLAGEEALGAFGRTAELRAARVPTRRLRGPI